MLPLLLGPSAEPPATVPSAWRRRLEWRDEFNGRALDPFHDLEEGVSTRLLVYCASLIDTGLPARQAVRATMIEPLTDEPDVKAALHEVADAVIR